MPSKNILKYYKENSYYHIYNRGVAKQKIFNTSLDYKTFLNYLKIYLIPKQLIDSQFKTSPSKEIRNYSDQVNLLAYCLMPNHFHLLIFQKDKFSIANFMRSLGTKYSVYFNRANDRVGPVFQSRYKAVRIIEKDHLLLVSKYIHRNPIKILPTRTDLVGYKYSSYANYLGKFKQKWIEHEVILDMFNEITDKNLNYRNFVELENDDTRLIKDKLIDL